MTQAFLNVISSGEYLAFLPMKVLLIASLVALARHARSKTLQSPPTLFLASLALLTFIVWPLGNGALIWYHETIAVVNQPRVVLQSIRLTDNGLLAGTIWLAAVLWYRQPKSAADPDTA